MPGLFRVIGAAIVIGGLSACQSQIDFKSPQGTQIYAPKTPVAGPPGGVGPPPGRTAAERQARKTYYGGPRGEEWGE